MSRWSIGARDPGNAGLDRGRRGDPHQEDSVDVIECAIKRFGDRQISLDDFDVWRNTSGVWSAGQGSDLHSGGWELGEDFAANGAGAAYDEDVIHRDDFSAGRVAD